MHYYLEKFNLGNTNMVMILRDILSTVVSSLNLYL